MRINSFNPNLSNVSSNKTPNTQPVKGVAARSSTCLELNKIPSLAFTGVFFNPLAKKVSLPNSLKDITGEIYPIKLFDKIRNEKIDGFLGYDNLPYGRTSYGEKAAPKLLTIYDDEARPIGGVSLNFSEWQGNMPDSKYGACSPVLPHPYTRLHLMAGSKNIAGVGSSLIQAAVEKSIANDAQGRIFVYASNYYPRPKNDPFVFYNKMGLSLKTPGEDAYPDWRGYFDQAAYELDLPDSESLKLLDEFKGNKFKKMNTDEKMLLIYETLAKKKSCGPDEIYLGFRDYMYLHDDKIKDFWLPKIEANPIFSEANKLK